MRKAYDWIKAGRTLHWIAAEFERLGVRAYRGGSHWSQWAIKEVILNPAHAGLLMRDGELVEGKHFEQRIVEPEEYYNIAKHFAAKSQVGPALKKSPNHIFGLHTLCGVCGKRMRVSPRPGGARYECSSTYSGGKHAGYSVRIDWVEKRIVEAIRNLASNGELVEKASLQVTEIVGSDHANQQKERARAEQDLEKAKRELIRWCERFNSQGDGAEDDAGGNADSVVFEIYRDELTRRISGLQARIAELKESDNEAKLRTARLNDSLAILRDFDTLWDAMDSDERKTLASYLVDYIRFMPQGTWVGVSVKLVLQEEVTFQVPVRGRGGRATDGLDSLSPMELTAAHYYVQGYTDHEIAAERDVSIATVRSAKASLIRRTGAGNLEEALTFAGPLVEARKEELGIGIRRGRHYREHFTDWQVELLRLLGQGLRVEGIAESTGKTRSAIYGLLDNLYRKLGVHSRDDAVREARRRHIIDGPTIWSAAPTPNQLAVLRQLAEGRSQVEAAESLGVTVSALKTRMRCMYDKFGVRTQDGLLALARERGWLK